MIPPPLDFNRWLAENLDMLKPPVNNFLLFQGSDTTVMVVGGPNRRTDYHINETEEWFYQIKGDLCIKVLDDDQFKDIVVREGSMFLLPPNIPHNPVRYADTIGIVVERVRSAQHMDALRWYCTNPECRQVVYEKSFHCTDLGTQLKPVIECFESSEQLRTCKHCGTVNELL